MLNIFKNIYIVNHFTKIQHGISPHLVVGLPIQWLEPPTVDGKHRFWWFMLNFFFFRIHQKPEKVLIKNVFKTGETNEVVVLLSVK